MRGREKVSSFDTVELRTILTDGVGHSSVSSSDDAAGTRPAAAASRKSASASPVPNENDDEKTGTPEATSYREGE